MPDINDAKRAFIRGAFHGLRDSTEDVMGRAQRDAPIEEGTLRASAEAAYEINGVWFRGPSAAREAEEAAVRSVDGPGRLEMRSEISFNTPYAAAQEVGHATMHRGDKTYEWVVRNHPRGGKAHYLGSNLASEAARFQLVEGSAIARSLHT